MALTGGGTGTSGVVVASPSTDPSQEIGDPLDPAAGGGRGSLGRDGRLGRGARPGDDRRPAAPRSDLFLAVLILVVALLATGIVYVSLTGRQADPVAAVRHREARPAATPRRPHRRRRRVPESGARPRRVRRRRSRWTASSTASSSATTPCAPEEPECWGGCRTSATCRWWPPRSTAPTRIRSRPSSPSQLGSQPRTQSDLEKTPAIQALCTKEVLNQRLVEWADRRDRGRSSRSRTRCSPRPTTSAAAW